MNIPESTHENHNYTKFLPGAKLQPRNPEDREDQNVHIGHQRKNHKGDPNLLAEEAIDQALHPHGSRSARRRNKARERGNQVDRRHHRATHNNGDPQPSDGFEDFPVKDEEGQFDEHVGYAGEPFDDIIELKATALDAVATCSSRMADLDEGVTRCHAERQIPEMSTKALRNHLQGGVSLGKDPYWSFRHSPRRKTIQRAIVDN